MTSLTDELWKSIAPIYAAILDHPFISSLTDGSLPRDAFRHFIAQDTHYLRDYARALAICAAKAPQGPEARAFTTESLGTLATEQEMHKDFAAELGLPAISSQHGPAVLPATRAYASYLLATAYGGSYAEAVAAILPCYLIYAGIGERLMAKSSPDPLYARWIAGYADPGFHSAAHRAAVLADNLGEHVAPNERRLMVEHFTTAARYEWMFWDAAWRGEAWPV